MTRTAVIIGLAILIVLMVATVSVNAQREHTMGPMMGPMMGHYDSKTEVTFEGTVEKIDRPASEHMPPMGLHLLVNSGNETFRVHLGPAEFVEKTMTFKEGDTVQVTGSKMMMMGETAIIAREVKKGEKVLKLRDENGMPLWGGMHRMHRWHS